MKIFQKSKITGKLNEMFCLRSKMMLMLTNIIVLGTKYDIFETHEMFTILYKFIIKLNRESRKWMSRILRYYCHTNSLSLYYVSVVNPKLSSQVYIFLVVEFKNKIKIKTLLSGYLFSDISPNVLQKDHMKPIFVSKGLDNIDSIGVTMVYDFILNIFSTFKRWEIFPTLIC